MSASHIPEAVRNHIRQEAQNRCGYCRADQKYVLGPLEIEHIIPQAQGGTDEANNLWLACRLCNSYKGTQISATDPLSGKRTHLFNPRQQQWSEHFAWSEDGTQILGKTGCGRATIVALQLNSVLAITVRRAWVEAGWHPPRE